MVAAATVPSHQIFTGKACHHGAMVIGFAHRGGRHTGLRENTLASFRCALTKGATAIETDAWVTADGVAVLDHDGVVGWRRRPIARTERSELPPHIPEAAEVYRQLGSDFDFSIDIKSAPSALPLVESVRAAGAQMDRVWLCHGDAAILRSWARLAPDVRLVHSASRAAVGEDLEGLAPAAHALNMRAREWTGELIDAAHAAGVLAFGWGVNDPGTLAALVAGGIDGVYSDEVEMMLSTIAAGDAV